MNTNRKTKIVEVKNIKTETIKVKFKSDTMISWIRYVKNNEYDLDKKLLNLIKNFIY